MITVLTILLTVHGLGHLTGVAKAFGWAAVPQITQPISPAKGLIWCLAAIVFLSTAVALQLEPTIAWILGFAGVALSTVAIVPSWSSARLGSIMNGLALIGSTTVFFMHGPGSLRAAYASDVDRGFNAPSAATAIVDTDLERLPAPVARYLRLAGVVGHPSALAFRARMHGRIRSGPSDRWMPFSAEQRNVLNPKARFFYLDASMFGLPVQGYHRYFGADATMDIRALGLVTVQRASGTTLTQAETVTLFNDMCVLAPGTLLDPAIEWRPVDDRTAEAVFTNAGHAIRATLSFNQAGELVDFWSDDRFETTPDGLLDRRRWSTPISGYRSFGPFRLASSGEARWHDASGSYAYIELTIDDVSLDSGAR